jgi:membrane protein DedA with SNARE-associated domain
MSNAMVATISIAAFAGLCIGYGLGWWQRGQQPVVRRDGEYLLFDGPLDLDMLEDHLRRDMAERRAEIDGGWREPKNPRR